MMVYKKLLLKIIIFYYFLNNVLCDDEDLINLIRNTQIDVNNVHSAKSNVLCPDKCSCLGDLADCSNHSLNYVPALSNWIENLDLSENSALNIGDIENIKSGSLKKLKLEKIHLTRIPVLNEVPSLRILWLAQNDIESIDIKSLEKQKQLVQLDLKKNQIKIILENSFPEQNILNKLFLTGNQISIIEDGAFTNLTGLSELRLNYNKLTSIPIEPLKSVKLLRKLLDLNNNEIYEIKAFSFRNLNSLSMLKLKNNQIEKIYNDGFSGLDSLITLDLSSNALTTLHSQYFKGLTSLKNLHLDGNRITYIADGAFNSTPGLEKLILSNNRITLNDELQTPIFIALNQLKKLDLSTNQIKIIQPSSFTGLNNLVNLNLNMNNVTTILIEGFLHLNSLKTLKINSRYLVCDCNFRRFYGWLKNHNFYDVTAACDHPNNLKGIILRELKEENFTCYDLLKPTIIEEPKSQMVIHGTNMTLTCIATSTSSTGVRISWRRDGIDLTTNLYDVSYNRSDNSNTSLVISKLKINGVSSETSGKYQCAASNEYGITYSTRCKIVVAIYPSFTKVPSNVTLQSGESARLNCAATGDPRPQIAWQKDGGHDFPAARERRMHVMPEDDAFFISNAKITDQGVYSCTAENSVGIIIANATLTINEPPSFVKPMENKEVNSGKSIVLECMASGSPKPRLRWLKDNKTIDTTERHFFAADNQLLIIVDAKFSDSGNYKCEIKNDLGVDTGFLNLTVSPLVVTQIFNFKDMLGVIIITVFCCAVVTSIVWVIIIYQAKKRNSNFNANNSNISATATGLVAPPSFNYEPSLVRTTETCFSDNQQNNILQSTTTIPPSNLNAFYRSPAGVSHFNQTNGIDDDDDAQNEDDDNEQNPLHSVHNSVITNQYNSSSRLNLPQQINYHQHRPSLTSTTSTFLPQRIESDRSSTSPPPPPQSTSIVQQSTPQLNASHLTNGRPVSQQHEVELRMNDLNLRMNHNLHENKLNKLDNLLMNSNGNCIIMNGGGDGSVLDVVSSPPSGGVGVGFVAGNNVASGNNKMACISIGSLDSVHSLKQSL